MSKKKTDLETDTNFEIEYIPISCEEDYREDDVPEEVMIIKVELPPIESEEDIKARKRKHQYEIRTGTLNVVDEKPLSPEARAEEERRRLVSAHRRMLRGGI